MTKPKVQRVSRVVEVPPAAPEGFRTLAQLFLEDFGIQIGEGEWAEGGYSENIPVINAAKLNSLESNLYYTKNGSPVTGLERTSVESGDDYCFNIYNPTTVTGVSAPVYWEVLLIKSDEGYFFKIAGVEDSPEDSIPSEEEYRTLNQLFLDDFGIQINGTMGTDGLSEEQNLVLDTNKLDAFRDGLYFYLDADGYMQSPQRDEVTGDFLPAPEDWTGPFTNIWCDANPQEDGYYHFGISNPAREAGASDCLIKSEEGFFFKRVSQIDDESESEPEPGSEPEPEPEPTPELEPAPPEPAPPEPNPEPTAVPVPLPTPKPEPPAKSALEEVYGTLSSQKLCTIVGLRTLLAKEQGISIKEAKSRITAVFKAVSDIAALSGMSSLYGLGVFRQQKVKARTVVSHLGFGTYKLPRSSKFVFKPGKILKAKMAMCTGKTSAQIITTLQNLDTIAKAKSTVRKATRKKSIQKSGTSGK